jgi:hypothetical protein
MPFLSRSQDALTARMRVLPLSLGMLRGRKRLLPFTMKLLLAGRSPLRARTTMVPARATMLRVGTTMLGGVTTMLNSRTRGLHRWKGSLRVTDSALLNGRTLLDFKRVVVASTMLVLNSPPRMLSDEKAILGERS